MSHGDVPSEEARRALERTAREIADYLSRLENQPVFPEVRPGAVAAALPQEPPPEPEALDRILDDFLRIIEPNLNHWNHPGFMAYFAISGSVPGILGEALAAAVNVNAMKWQTSPAATELEERTCDWLRQMVGLPEVFRGHINDTASTGTLLALSAARYRACDDIRNQGAASGPPVTVYCSEQAHSSVDKAAMVLGFGLDYTRHVPTDADFRMLPEALEGAIQADRDAGKVPIAVVATLGTTSTTSVDPVAAIAEVCARYKLWLHVDAAYAGSAAICEELRHLFDGWAKADSIVINPHKWMFTPVDCSVLFVRDLSEWRGAFALVPEYLRSTDEAELDLMDLGFQLGRRFRSLKLWMVIRAFGVQGLAERIREHCRIAGRLAEWIDDSPWFERMAPTPFSTVCFRAVSPDLEDDRLDDLNEQLLARINRHGTVFVSHTRLNGELVLRAAVGNIKTGSEHVAELWRLAQSEAELLRAKG